jgi:hypothetical protein
VRISSQVRGGARGYGALVQVLRVCSQ